MMMRKCVPGFVFHMSIDRSSQDDVNNEKDYS
jgi:hypothetical protein